jgi:hypothetical protein
MSEIGNKFDDGKPQAGLLVSFAPALEEIAKVATFGADKYGRDNWLKVKNGKLRYFDAAWRHRLEGMGDFDSIDKESGCLHLAHEIWNMLAVLTIHLSQKK